MSLFFYVFSKTGIMSFNFEAAILLFQLSFKCLRQIPLREVYVLIPRLRCIEFLKFLGAM